MKDLRAGAPFEFGETTYEFKKQPFEVIILNILS